ncbi:DUF1302 family protein [Magnetovibrio sp. PR-2]|uniref:DUF1302 family protein n=1 Tax=Magnetovibrio sp. PR-2 TaxID=3120356 RepID=UPI002FCE2D9D
MIAKRTLFAFTTLAMFAGTGASAQEDLDDILGGFEELETTQPTDVEELAPPSDWELSGSASFSAAYDYTQNEPASGESDKRGLSRARPKLTFKLKGDLTDTFDHPVRFLGEISAAHELVYTIKGRGDYNDTVKGSFEKDVNLGELYLSGEITNDVELTVGRQTIVWGTSDNLRVVDLINPLDRRELGMVDIEDVRLPLAMARMDYVTGPWTATGLVIPHIRFNKFAPSYSAYDSQNGAATDQLVPRDGLGNAEIAGRLSGNFSGWDLAFHAANVYDDSGAKKTINGETTIHHARITMAGVSTAVALGNWLAKGEAAHLTGLETFGLQSQDFARTDVLAGVDYTGFTDTTISFEVVNRHLWDYSAALSAEGLKEDSQEYALRYSADFMHDRLNVTLLTTRISPLTTGGGFSRGVVEYDLADALTLSGGVTVYHDGTRTPFKGLGDNDRVFVELKKSF